MPEYIKRNVAMDRVRENSNAALQRGLQEQRLQDSVRARQTAQTQDELGRNIARIYGEGAPVAQTGADALGGVAAQPVDTRRQRAMQLASETPGGGGIALDMAKTQMAGETASGKSREALALKVHEMLGAGNIGGAEYFARANGLRQFDSLFQNPTAVAAIVATSGYAHKRLGLSGQDAAAYTESVLTHLKTGKSMAEASELANREIKERPGKVKSTFVDDSGRVSAIDEYGNPVPIRGARGKSKSAAAVTNPEEVVNKMATSLYKEAVKLNPDADPMDSIKNAQRFVEAQTRAASGTSEAEYGPSVLEQQASPGNVSAGRIKAPRVRKFVNGQFVD